MPDNKTIAFWCEKSNAGSEATAEFHVNLWHFAKTGRSDFIEVGALLSKPEAISTIRIYLPFSVGYNEIKDLGSHFLSTDLSQGIFNESLSSTMKPNGKSIILADGNSRYCNVYIFSTDKKYIDDNEMTIAEKDGGTLITITSAAIASLARQSDDTPCPGYFRLRIFPKTKGQRPFVTTIVPKDRAWTSGFEVIEYIDCRLNEPRTLPKAIEQVADSAEFGLTKTTRVVFLAVVPVVSAVTASHAEWHKSRLLETEIWERYVPDGLEDGMVVYHWRKIFAPEDAASLQGFSAFVKMQTRRTNWLIISIYVLLALLIGGFGSLLASAFNLYFFGSLDS